MIWLENLFHNNCPTQQYNDDQIGCDDFYNNIDHSFKCIHDYC